MMMMMMMIVDLYSALRRAPLLRYVSRCIVKRSRFQTIGRATEIARRPNLLRRWRGTISWWWVADRRRWRLAMSD